MPDPAVELARSRTTLLPSDSSASGFRRVIEVPEPSSRKKRGKKVGFFTRDEEYPIQAGGPSLESYYPQLPPEPTYDPTQYSLGASDPIYSAEPDGRLGWLERRRLEKYEKQKRKDQDRELRDAEKFREKEERWKAKEERKRLKESEKELHLYTKASTHSPWNPFKSPTHTHYPINPPVDPGLTSGEQVVTPYYYEDDRRGFWGSLFSPAWEDPYQTNQGKKQKKLSKRTSESAWTRYPPGTPMTTPSYPFAQAKPGRPELYTGLGLPLAGQTGGSGTGLMPMDSGRYGGLGYGKPGLAIDGRVMSRTMTHALMEMDHDAYLRTGQRGFII